MFETDFTLVPPFCQFDDVTLFLSFNIKVIISQTEEERSNHFKMPPLMQHDIDISPSSLHGDGIPQEKSVATPLHEEFDFPIAPPPFLPKEVSFAPFVVVKEIISRKELTPAELKAAWYDVEEVSCMRGIARTEAKLVESGHLVQSKEVCIRGLEQRTRKGSKKKKKNRMNSYAAVFLEMDYQKAEMIFDDEAIAEAYFKYSMPSTTAAQRVGRRDEIEAIKSWRSPTLSHQKEKMRNSSRKGPSQHNHSGRSRRSIRKIEVAV